MKKYLMSSAGVVFAAMLAAPALAADGEVRIFTFEGYTDPDWVAQFEEQSGCEVKSTFTGSVDEMFAKMRGRNRQ